MNSMLLSRIVYGCASDAMSKGEDVTDVLDQVLDMGVNIFDTAENYGLSECSLGNWIKSRGIRNRVHIITKGCHPYGTG